MTTIFVICGKVNYMNLSRYSDRSERTYRRHLDWTGSTTAKRSGLNEGWNGWWSQLSTQSEVPSTEPVSFSMASFKRQALNAHLLDLFTAMFDLEPTLIKSHPNYRTLLTYGAIAA